jgi:hypothetical protein
MYYPPKFDARKTNHMQHLKACCIATSNAYAYSVIDSSGLYVTWTTEMLTPYSVTRPPKEVDA